jgi:hypothetical protein|tara:strand:+ start:1152 stop:1598 length:447 start_codon:yes stop_codon:yes gene_type:complete
MSKIPRITAKRILKQHKPVQGVDIGTTLLTEHEEQREFVKWFRQTYPSVRIFAIPNGGYRGKTQAMKLKAEGVSRGVPDLFIPEMFLWVEMKRKKGGTVAPEQKEWIDYLNGVGYRALVCRGCQDAQVAVTDYVAAMSAFNMPPNEIN